MEININKIQKDVLKKLYNNSISQEVFSKQSGVSRTTFWRMNSGLKIRKSHYIKMINWLNKSEKEYLL